jgi:hypothetical protein
MDRPDIRRSETPDAETPVSAPAQRDWGDDWVHESIAMTRPGVDLRLLGRLAHDRQVPWEFDDFN